MLQSEQVRKLRNEFRLSKNHQEVKPCSLIPDIQDKTVLFNTAGMQQLVPYLSGKVHPNGTKLYNIQRCIRTDDIEEVGDNTHCTLFEMMGNRSLGDYFKKESLTSSFEFLTVKLGIPISKLGATVFGGYDGDDVKIPLDTEAIEILTNLGIPVSKIQEVPMFKSKKCDNFRGPAGAIGPCGPCCEIYYDKGDEFGPTDNDFVNNGTRYVEIRNNVFMDMYKDDKGKYSMLSQKNIDTGMGFERLITILQDQKSIYETDLFTNILQTIQDITKTNYNLQNTEQTKFFRVVAEHMRTICLSLGDGVIPSNEGRGYVVRRLIRRMRYYLTKLNPNVEISQINFLVNAVTDKYGKFYTSLNTEKSHILTFLNKEIGQFVETVSKGIKMLDEEIKKVQKNKSDELDYKVAFKLYDTYGLPLDIMIEVCADQKLKLNQAGFGTELQDAKTKAKSGSQKMFDKNIDRASYLSGIPQTKFVGYDTIETSDFKILKDFIVDEQRVLILDQTPFYAESGGQIGDSGELVMDDGQILNIVDVKKYEGVFLHFVG